MSKRKKDTRPEEREPTEAEQEVIDEMLRLMQQSSNPNLKQMADYVVNLNTIEKHEGTKH